MFSVLCKLGFCDWCLLLAGKGGKNRRRGKNENEVKRELVFKEDGQGHSLQSLRSDSDWSGLQSMAK